MSILSEQMKDMSQKIHQSVREMEDSMILTALARDPEFLDFIEGRYLVRYRGGKVIVSKKLDGMENQGETLMVYEEHIDMTDDKMTISFREVKS